MTGIIWVLRRFCIYKLLLTKEKFYQRAETIFLQGVDYALEAWIASPQRGSHSQGLGCQEGAIDAVVTVLASLTCRGPSRQCIHDVIEGGPMQVVLVKYSDCLFCMYRASHRFPRSLLQAVFFPVHLIL